MPDTDATAAEVVMGKILAATRRAVMTGKDGAEVSVTVSVGLAEYGLEGDVDDLFRRADAALYDSKNEGRDGMTVAKSET